MDLPFFWILCILIGAVIGKRRGRAGSGVVWSALFGPLGWLIVLLLEDRRPKCPHCRSVYNSGASRCCHCGGEIPTTANSIPATPTYGWGYESKVNQRAAEISPAPPTVPFSAENAPEGKDSPAYPETTRVTPKGSIKCLCQTCSGHLEFDCHHAGTVIDCPHCGVETRLYIPSSSISKEKTTSAG